MKKIMLAMMATVGLAFFAKAEGTYTGSTDFEGEEFVVGNALPETDKGSGTGTAAFWANYVPAESESKIVAGGPNESTKYASLDTGNQVLLRQAEPGYTKDFGSIYFDTMVQFTASEGDPAVSTTDGDGDKLVIWLQSNEASEGTPASTNLMIRAGLLDTDFNATKSKDYQVEGEFEAGVWYRLTVKTFADIGLAATVPGFKVYIDGEEVSVTEGSSTLYNGYFASLVSRAVGTQHLTGIGFQGTGAVDDIVMTSEDPIPEVAPTTVALTVNVTGEYSSLVYIVGESTTTNEVDGTEASIEAAVDDVVTFVLTVADGYTPAVTGYELQKGEEQVDEFSDVYYPYTFTATVTQAMIDDGLTLTINVTEDGGEEPVVPETGTTPAGGGSATVKAADAEAAVEAVTVQGVNGTVYEASQKYYTKTAVETGTEGVFEVTVELDETALDEDVDAAVEAALEAVEAGATSVALPAGFYYKVESGSALPIATTATGVSTGATIEVKDLTEAAGFFKVSVGTTEFTE